MCIFYLDLPSDDPVRMKQLTRVFYLADNKNKYKAQIYFLCHWALYQVQVSNKKQIS